MNEFISDFKQWVSDMVDNPEIIGSELANVGGKIARGVAAVTGGAIESVGSVGAAVVVLCALAALPTFRGYRNNRVVIEQNEAAIAEGLEKGEITLCTDYLDTYRHTVMFEGDYFFTQFRLCYGIPEDMPVHLEGEHYAHWPIVIDGHTFRRHSAMTGSVLYLPMRELFDYYGVSIAWDFAGGRGFFIERAGERYYLSKDDNTIRRLADGAIVTEECYTVGITAHDYIEVHAAADFFGFDYTFDWQTVAIYSEQN